MKIILLLGFIGLAYCDVSHLVLPSGGHVYAELPTTTTPPPPPKPYAFGYAAGRFAGHIDRTHTEISDGTGVIKGSYSYIDPRHHVRTVDYIADKNGFHPILNTPQRPLPVDSPAVAAAKDKHYQLYAAIAEAHHHQPVPIVAALPRKTVSVAHAEAKHFDLYQKIAAEHARIAAEREVLKAATAEPNYIENEEHY